MHSMATWLGDYNTNFIDIVFKFVCELAQLSEIIPLHTQTQTLAHKLSNICLIDLAYAWYGVTDMMVHLPLLITT